MKLLVLMPLDEKMVYNATTLYEALPEDVKEHTFPMPMYMQYLMTTKVCKNWIEAFFDSILSARALYRAAEKGGHDLIILGNIDKDFKFDAVFNFQDAELTLPYEDKFAQKIQTIVESEEPLLSIVSNLHTAEESKFSLRNCQASATFLSSYLTTDPKLDEIKAKYADVLKFKEEVKYDA